MAAVPGTTADLFVAPNSSLAGALFVAEHCAPIMRSQVNASNDFFFESVPAGTYVVVVGARAFAQGHQGFPIISSANASGYSVRMVFHGGNRKFSLAVFSIRQCLEAGSVAEHSSLWR